MDMHLLKARGVSAGSYKRIFSGDAANYPPQVKKLVDLIANRARRSIGANIQDWRAYAAIDTAFDTPFQQTTPTLIRNLLSQKFNSAEEVKAALNGWGLREQDLFIRETLPDGTEGLVPNAPLFYGIIIPLVKSVVAMRLGKIFNERNISPLLEYKPLKTTSRNQVLCEIITDMGETMSSWYGYPAVLRQCIQQMLKYGVMLTFPYEEWHCEEQTTLDEAGVEKTITVKEGLRYYIPHPTRMFYDMTHPLTTINSDTGVGWCGHWTVRPYGDILDDRRYWNRKNVFAGTNWFNYGYGSEYYFQEFFPCAMASDFCSRFPSPVSREDKAAWYNNSDRDQAVFLTEFFIKLTPSEWGLGQYEGRGTKEAPWGKLVNTYNHPVWHRFTLAGDDTVIYAEPMAYTPSWFMGYHYDSQAGHQSSLGLETVPWQDYVGDVLNHIIDVAKQNLANCTFYDENLVDKSDIERIQKRGSRTYRGWNFIGYDSLLQQRAGAGPATAFQPVRFDKQSIVELLQALPIILNIMERVLQISAQEVGAAASHQQGNAEINQIGSASTNGVVFTSSFVDEGVDAWMRQLYDAQLAYKDPQIIAQVSADIPNLQAMLAEIGFAQQGAGKDIVMVKGHKQKLRLEGFASTNQGPAIAREKEMAQVVFNTIAVISNQPELFKRIGAKNLLALLEEAAKLGGAPRGFTLNMPTEGQDQGDVPEAVLAAIEQAQQATMQAIGEKVAKPAAEAVAADQQKIAQLEQVVKQLTGIYEVAAAEQEKAKAIATKVATDAQRKDAIAAKDQQRKDAIAQANIARDTAKAAAELELAQKKTEGELAIKSAQAVHQAAIDSSSKQQPD